MCIKRLDVIIVVYIHKLLLLRLRIWIDRYSYSLEVGLSYSNMHILQLQLGFKGFIF
jgi:hypothetical protein